MTVPRAAAFRLRPARNADGPAVRALVFAVLAECGWTAPSGLERIRAAIPVS